MLKQKHQQLYDILKGQLSNGQWKAGERLPNLRELAAQYSVSVNIAAKAVNLLKDEKLVQVRAGDGIYSATSGNAASAVGKFSGNRLFGTYGKSKILKVLLEDNLDVQWEFWEGFFQKFAEDNVDIELEIHRCAHTASELANVERYDLALGGMQYMLLNGFTGDKLHDIETFRQLDFTAFPPRIITAKNVFEQRGKHYLPYGAVPARLYSNQPIPPALPEETALAYAQRIQERYDGVFVMLRGLSFLENSGISFLDQSKTSFQMPDKGRMLEVFRQMKELHDKGALVWFHGQFTNYDKLWPPKNTGKLLVAEAASNSVEAKLRSLPSIIMPGMRYNHTLVSLAAARTCRYPEECLRLYHALLEPATQRALANNLHILPVVKGVSAELDGMEGKIGFTLENLTNAEMSEVMYKIVDWELLKYLFGQRGDEIYDLIKAKVKYYLQCNFPESEK